MTHEGTADSATSPARGLRCLIVDDDPFLRMLIADIVRDMGHVAVEAGDPDTALATLQRDSFDIMLTDMNLPYMDGIELARRARLSFPELRVVFATAYSESRLPDLSGDPLARYLRKPFGEKELRGIFASLGYASPG